MLAIVHAVASDVRQPSLFVLVMLSSTRTQGLPC